MKRTSRILLGILFPFILLLTVTTISKALKNDSNPEQTLPEKTESSKIKQNSSPEVKIQLTHYRP